MKRLFKNIRKLVQFIEEWKTADQKSQQLLIDIDQRLQDVNVKLNIILENLKDDEDGENEN